MKKQTTKSKIIFSVISLVITFFVWQQGLKDSLERPSVIFDISQKEIEITELALPSIPKDLKKIFINNPSDDMRSVLSKVGFEQLSDRSKLIATILSNEKREINNELVDKFDNDIYKNVIKNIIKRNKDNSFIPSEKFFYEFSNDRYIYYLLSKNFGYDGSLIISKNLSQIMFSKLIIIRLIPLITILFGSILLIKNLWKVLIAKSIQWKEITSLELDLLDMVLLISGGFVVLGEVFSPLLSITIVNLFSRDLSFEITQSLKIFFGYIFMALPPLLIVFNQIKSIDKEFIFKKDYFQFNFKPITKGLLDGIRGWIMIIPIVLLTSLVMNQFIENQMGSNPLLEIVLNNNNYFAFLILFITTTILAPLFEEIIFRGVLLPVLSRDFGKWFGILFSSFIFALAHLSFSEFPPLFVLGIGLAFTRLISGRLISSVIMHSLWNGLTFLNLYLLRT
tara:strand:- start:1474 stop:2826 length:1353 start_codon:yes stop_codon:yes gene_type:complete